VLWPELGRLSVVYQSLRAERETNQGSLFFLTWCFALFVCAAVVCWFSLFIIYIYIFYNVSARLSPNVHHPDQATSHGNSSGAGERRATRFDHQQEQDATLYPLQPMTCHMQRRDALWLCHGFPQI
jgi:hypothetical protein